MTLPPTLTPPFSPPNPPTLSLPNPLSTLEANMYDDYPYSRYPEIAYDELYESSLTPVLDYAADIVDGHIPYPFVDPEDRELGLIPSYGSFESYD